MNLKTFIIFLSAFLLIYTGINSYVILRLGGLLGIGSGILYLCIGLVTLSLPLALYVEKIFPNFLSKIFYLLSTLWMGILLFMLPLLLIYEVISLFYIIPSAGIIIILLVILLSIISIINAIEIEVKEVEVPIKNLKKNITLVQISDVHLGTIRNSGFLKKIVKKINQLDPTIVMITGDMVDGSSRLHESMFDEFNKLNAPIYFVSGNHEVMEGINKVYSLFKNTKIRVLRNEKINFEDFQIVGVEYSEEKGHLKRELEKFKIDKTKLAVLMYHSPEGFENAKKAGITLQLAGHTHNGQIFPFNFVVRLFFKHIKGLYNLGNMFLYVSPGTGTWGPYMRLGSRNEITLLKLIKN